MGLRISTNVQSLAAQRSLNQVRREQSGSLEKLSSGSRINKAGDDAAGLAISEKLKANIRSTQQANRNAGDGISLIQTAEGGLNEVGNILIRLRELSVQSANDTLGDAERSFSDQEFQQLVKEVDRIAAATNFNGKNLLTGQGESMDFQIGIQNDDFNDRISFDPATQDVKSSALGLESLTVTTKEESQVNLDVIDEAISKVSGNRATLGALQNRLQSTVRNLEIQAENQAASNSRIRDTEIAGETAKLAKNNILTASSTSVLSQANSNGSIALQLLG